MVHEHRSAKPNRLEWTDTEFRGLLEAAPDAMVIADERGAISLVNAQTEKLFGYHREELLGKPVEMLIPERYRGAHIHHRRGYGDSPRLRPMGAGQELFGLRKDGSEFPVEISLSPFHSSQGMLVFSAIRDITLQKAAQHELLDVMEISEARIRALRRSEAYLSEAQSLTRIGSWAWNPHLDKILHCSEEIYRIYAMDPRDGVPTFEALMQRVHPEDRDWVLEHTLEGTRKKLGQLLEYRIVLPDGTLKYIQSVRRPVLNAEGEVAEIVGTSIDVTERKLAEQERERLQQLDAELAHMNRVSLLGELAGSLAHEIKQPIAAVVTSADACLRWLQRDPPDVGRARSTAGRIKQDASRAAEIINRLQSLYKKGPTVEHQVVDVNEIVEEMIDLLHGEVVRNSILVRTELAADDPKILADRVQLQQVLMNLMLNAIEAMKETGGELAVRTELNQDGQMLVSISDTGVGLPADNRDQIFEAFFTTKPQGTGMGLAITRSLIEAHGGRVWAISNTGRGATFQFTLPTKTEPRA